MRREKINFVWLLAFAFVTAVALSMIAPVQALPPTPSKFNINCFEDAAYTINANPNADWAITFTSEGVGKTWDKTHNSGTGEAPNTVFYGTYQGKTNLYSKVLPADSGTTITFTISGYQSFTLTANPGEWIAGSQDTPVNRQLIIPTAPPTAVPEFSPLGLLSLIALMTIVLAISFKFRKR